MAKWSKLQRELYKIIDDRIDFQIHCVAYRMNITSSTRLPRYFITLGDEIIFDYPKQFMQQLEHLQQYPYYNDASKISEFIREYIDTPTEELLDKNFDTDRWQLADILKAADRRIGQRRLDELLSKTDSEASKAIIHKRKNINGI